MGVGGRRRERKRGRKERGRSEEGREGEKDEGLVARALELGRARLTGMSLFPSGTEIQVFEVLVLGKSAGDMLAASFGLGII